MKTLAIVIALTLATPVHAWQYCNADCKAAMVRVQQQAGSEYLKKITAIKRNEERSKACRALAHDRSIGVKIGLERAMMCDGVDTRY